MPISVTRAATAAPFVQRLLACSALSLVFACAAASGTAAQTAPTQLPPVNVEAERDNYQVDRASSPKFTEPLRDTPRSITIIPQEVIRERGALSVTDVLRTVPGISLGAGEGGIAAGDRTFIRGYEARGDSFVDGARDLGAYFRDPFNIEQIEVLKGPGSSYSGRGSTGGSINYVMKAPKKDDFTIGALTFGTDMTKRATVDTNQVVGGNVGLRFNAMFHDSEVAGRDEVTQQRWGVAPSVTVGMDRDTRWTFSYYHYVQNNLPDYGHPFNTGTGRPVDVDRNNFYGLKNRDYDDAYADAATVKFEHEFNEAFTLRNQTRYGIVDRNFVVTKPEFTAGASTVVRQVRARDTHETALVNQTDLTSKFETGFIKHNVVTGLELSNEESKSLTRNNGASTPAANLLNPNTNDPFSFVPSYTGAGNEVQAGTIALYAFDTMKLSEQWEVTGGLRWDHVDTDFTGIAANGVETPLGRVDKLLSYSAGIVYKPVPIGSIYVAYGTSFNPSAEFQSLSTATANTDATVNTPPEKNVSYEIGTKWDVLKERLSLTAAIFRTEKTNARINDPFGTDQVLDGKNRVDGVELGFAGNITDKWKAFGGYTYLDSEIIKSSNAAETGKKFANIAPHNFSLWTTYQITTDIGVGGGATYAARRYANNTNTLQLPSYWRFDAMASYKLTENVDLQLNILNITDEYYYDSTHNGQHALVAPGRAALLTTTAHF